MDEQRLLRQAQKGDTIAFEKLVEANAQYVYNLALRILRNPHEAEDLSQEAFVRVWKNLPNFRLEARFRTWLYRIVTNLCYDRVPKLKRELSALDPDENIQLVSERTTPEKHTLNIELRTLLHDAIDELPDSYRLLITLRHMLDLNYNEIAEATGQPLGTVKTGIFRARRLLRDAIEEYEAENEERVLR
jgi:RNA polymerase sigma-70 factor (ECF subfamily)